MLMFVLLARRVAVMAVDERREETEEGGSSGFY